MLRLFFALPGVYHFVWKRPASPVFWLGCGKVFVVSHVHWGVAVAYIVLNDRATDNGTMARSLGGSPNNGCVNLPAARDNGQRTPTLRVELEIHLRSVGTKRCWQHCSFHARAMCRFNPQSLPQALRPIVEAKTFARVAQGLGPQRGLQSSGDGHCALSHVRCIGHRLITPTTSSH